jgi:hypothetical protein
MRTGSLICAAAMGLALAGPAPAMAEPDDVVELSGVTVTVRKPEPTELSGLTVVARKHEPTPVSELTVTVHRATPLSGLTVTAPKCPQARNPPDAGVLPPRLISSFPASGARVRPGVLILRLTFDRPMTCDGLLNVHAFFPDPCPKPLRDPVISRDRRTFLTVCQIDGGKRYGLRLNRFTSMAGRRAPPIELVFDTSPETKTASIEEAITQDPWLRQAATAQP